MVRQRRQSRLRDIPSSQEDLLGLAILGVCQNDCIRSSGLELVNICLLLQKLDGSSLQSAGDAPTELPRAAKDSSISKRSVSSAAVADASEAEFVHTISSVVPGDGYEAPVLLGEPGREVLLGVSHYPISDGLGCCGVVTKVRSVGSSSEDCDEEKSGGGK